MEKTEYLSFGAKDWYERGQRLTQGGCHVEAIEALSQAGDDIDAAAILGCRDAQFWSKHSIPPLTISTGDRQE